MIMALADQKMMLNILQYFSICYADEPFYMKTLNSLYVLEMVDKL